MLQFSARGTAGTHVTYARKRFKKRRTERKPAINASKSKTFTIVVTDLFSRVWPSACTVSGTMSTCSFFFIYLILDSISFFLFFFFFNKLYNYYTFCSDHILIDHNEWIGIIFIGIEIKETKFICFKVFGFKKYSKRF